jgi:uncharacterized protein YceK
MFLRLALTLAILSLSFTGCSNVAERKHQGAEPGMSAQASNITVYRDNSSRDGLFNMMVFVNSVPVKGLDPGERHSFSLEPGTYVLSYSLGLTECDETVKIEPRRDYVFKLAPSCVMTQERG